MLDTVTNELTDDKGASTSLLQKLSAIEQTASGIELRVETTENTMNNLNTSSRNLFKNTLNPGADVAEDGPMLIGQTINTQVSTGTVAVAEHGIRNTMTTSNYPQIRFGSNSVTSANAGLNGLTAGTTYSLSFDYTAKLYSGSPSGAGQLAVFLYTATSSATSFTLRNSVPVDDRPYWDGSTGHTYGSEQSGAMKWTFTIPTGTAKCYIAIRPTPTTTGYCASGDFIEVRNLMMVEGAVASSWIAAPEDMTSYADKSATDAAASIKLYVDGDTYKSGIRMSADEITWEADNSSLDSTGHLEAGSATFTNAEIDCRAANGWGLSIGPYGDLVISTVKPSDMSSFDNECAFQVNNWGDVKLRKLALRDGATEFGSFEIQSAFSRIGLMSNYPLHVIPSSGGDVSIRVPGSSTLSYLYQGNSSGNKFWVHMNIATDCDVAGYLTVSGTKNRRVTTDDFGDVLLSAYETPTPMFGDVGEGIIGSDGLCYVTIDPVFAQTISTNNYQVFLQKYGEGDMYVLERKSAYFIVKGTAGLPRWGADGEWGNETKSAVKAFQTAKGIEANGELNPATLAALGLRTAVVKVFGGTVNVRSAPDATDDDNILGTVEAGCEPLPYQGQDSNGWHLVEYIRQNAWISGKWTTVE